MREILFRGKRLDNGEWVEGNLVFSTDAEKGWGTIIIPSKGSDMYAGVKNLGFQRWYRVDPETVCQFHPIHIPLDSR